MSHRGRPSRLVHLNKIKDAPNKSVQDVVSEVIRNIAATEEQDADNLRSYLSTCGEDTTVIQPGDLWSSERKAGKRQSKTPPQSRPLVCGLSSQHSRKVRRRSSRFVASDDQADLGVSFGRAQGEQTEFDADLWMDDPLMIEPAKVTDIEASDSRPKKRNGFGRQSLSPPYQPLATDPQQPRALQTQSFCVQVTDDPANHTVVSGGDQAEKTKLGSCGNMWANDLSVTEPTQDTATETNDLRPRPGNTAERQSLSPPPSCSRPADFLNQLGHLQRNWVHDNAGEPAQDGLSEARHSKPSKHSSEMEFDDTEEADFDDMEEMESDGEPAEDGWSQDPNLNPPNWSNEIHFDELEEVEMRDSKGKRGKKGGSILPRHVWSLRPGVRFVVPFNSFDQPVGKGGFVLIRFLGDVAKVGELCPIGEINWPKVDKSCKAKIIALIREKFVIPDGRQIDRQILKHVGNRWRAHRHNLKMDYKKPGKTQEQVASIVPKGVIPSQWVKLVEYWFSEKCKLYCKNGKAARNAQLHIHTTGAKSFARKREEFEKAHGREPGALEWFLKTHQRKDGTFVENTTKEFVDTASALVSQRGSTSSPKKRIAVENEVFKELMYSDEEKAYQRPLGYGFGITGDKVFGLEGELRKRGYWSSGYESKIGRFKRKQFSMTTEGRNSSYLASESSADVERLNFAMVAMGETNELMQGQIKMQSQQLQMQSQQLRTQAKQIEGLQVQLEQVTSLLTKFGSKLNSPQINRMPKGVRFQGVGGPDRQVFDTSSESDGGESDSSEWYSD